MQTSMTTAARFHQLARVLDDRHPSMVYLLLALIAGGVAFWGTLLLLEMLAAW